MQKSIKLFVPGRLCLFGEHSDWAGLQRVINADIIPGASIVTGIEQGIYADIEANDKFVMHNTSDELKDFWVDFESAMQMNELKKTAASDSYFSYVAGVASYICENYHTGGLKITITKMTLPVKSGLSSSAAVCVLVARAFNIIYGLNLNTMGEMTIAFKGEQRTKSRCGRLDQACAFGVTPVLMTFDGEDIDVQRLIVKKPLHWVFAHLKGNKNTIKILSDLNKCYPFAQNEIEKNVHFALGEENQEIIQQAIEYIKTGEIEKLGKLMTHAQELFDKKVAPASWEELKAVKLHSILGDTTVKSLTYGGKGVGSQGDGSVQFLARDAQCQQKLVNYLNEIDNTAYSLTIKPRHLVHKAIIPVAGFGTRLYPATRAVKKEFMPVIDSDGLVKPVILILLEQLHESGIDEICLIVSSEEDIDFYKKYFQKQLIEDHHNKLPLKMREYENKIFDIGKSLSFIIQTEKKGFGHAVFQSKDFCKDEPVLLLLGDTIYCSNTQKTCSMQLMEVYEEVDRPVISIHEITVDEAVHYGILSGIWEDKNETVLKVKQFVEKPSVEYAEDFLGIECLQKEKKYYSVFGQYILTPEVFTELGTNIKTGQNTEKNGEIGLTAALSGLIDKDGLYGVVINGQMFDIGNSKSYFNALKNYSGAAEFC
ncbi:MAG: sugar phosphate nucleotidyltransferase [Treponema sp.]|nr:sugar phosphate nucleotidyltransferase [Treponema sp.]